MFKEDFRKAYDAGRAAFERESLGNNYSYPATLIAVLVPALLVGVLFVWLQNYKTLSLIERIGVCIVASALLQYLAMRIHNRLVKKT